MMASHSAAMAQQLLVWWQVSIAGKARCGAGETPEYMIENDF